MPTPRDRHILDTVHTHNRLTREHIRRLFFRRPDGRLATVQAVNYRLAKLVARGYLEPIVVDAGRGAGPYAYGLGPRGKALLSRPAVVRWRTNPGPVWHHLEIAEFRVRLQEALADLQGALVEWQGEGALRSLLRGRRAWPVPDALVHWRLPEREGTFLLEWDRGSESLAILTAKLARYQHYWRARGHRELVPGLGLRPRLAVVLRSGERSHRLIRWIEGRRESPLSTVLVGVAAEILPAPLDAVWWRSDTRANGSLLV